MNQTSNRADVHRPYILIVRSVTQATVNRNGIEFITLQAAILYILAFTWSGLDPSA
jgi:hypothetical protein